MRSEPHLLRSLCLPVISHQCRGQSPAPMALTSRQVFHSFPLQLLSADPLLHPGEEATHRVEVTQPPMGLTPAGLCLPNLSPAPDCPPVTCVPDLGSACTILPVIHASLPLLRTCHGKVTFLPLMTWGCKSPLLPGRQLPFLLRSSLSSAGEPRAY